MNLSVSVAQQPQTSVEDDVKAINRTLDAMGCDRVLVYVAAYLPDVGETLRDIAR